MTAALPRCFLFSVSAEAAGQSFYVIAALHTYPTRAICTSRLLPQVPPGLSKAARIAIGRQRPPLAASAAVWRARDGPAARLQHAVWPRREHVRAAAAETDYWLDVHLLLGLRPASGRGAALSVPPAHGPITCIQVGCLGWPSLRWWWLGC